MMTINNPVIDIRRNPFSEKLDYLLRLTREQYLDFRSRGLNAKESRNLFNDDDIYWIRVVPHSLINNDEDYLYNKMKDFLKNDYGEMDIMLHVLEALDKVVVRCIVDVDNGLRKKED